MESGVRLLDVAVCSANVFEASGPSAAEIANAAVFKIESRQACSTERFAEMPGMNRIVSRPPKPTVDLEAERDAAALFEVCGPRRTDSDRLRRLRARQAVAEAW